MPAFTNVYTATPLFLPLSNTRCTYFRPDSNFTHIHIHTSDLDSHSFLSLISVSHINITLPQQNLKNLRLLFSLTFPSESPILSIVSGSCLTLPHPYPPCCSVLCGWSNRRLFPADFPFPPILSYPEKQNVAVLGKL